MNIRTTTVSILLTLAITLIANVSPEKRIICYYTNWSVYRNGIAKFTLNDIDPNLCTHLIYAFGTFTDSYSLKPLDQYQDVDQRGYQNFNALKRDNKNLKTLLAIGGWSEGSSRFSVIVGNSEYRQTFIKNAITFIRQYQFDGLNIDWVYPAFRDGSKPEDKQNYAQFIQEFREEFDKESQRTGKSRLLLSIAVPPNTVYVDQGYDIPKLNKYLDWMDILSYDYHDTSSASVNHHSPLYELEENLSVDATVKHYLKAGADPDKLIVAIPTFGRSYKLFNPDSHEIGAPADGPGDMGEFTKQTGFLAYFEICNNIMSNGWKVVQPKSNISGPYAYKGNQWVGYDNIMSVKRKAEYVNRLGLGGVVFWSLDSEDFKGTCNDKKYPLISTAKDVLFNTNGPDGTERPGAQKCDRISLTTVNNQPVCKNKILFEDNFINLDENKWKSEIRIAAKPDYEFCIYVNFPENIAVKNGNLYLKPTLATDRYGEDFVNTQINLGRNCTGIHGTIDCSKSAQSFQILPPILSGKISTKDNFSFKYGKVEIRAKLPKGKWIYPIIALQPAYSEYGIHYDSGEIRIAFVPGNDNLGKDLVGGIILSSSEEGRTYGTRHSISDEHWGNAFHTYSLTWTPDFIALSVDGTEYARITPPTGGFGSVAGNLQSNVGDRWSQGTPMAPFDKEMFLTLGVGVGGHSFSDIIPGKKPWKNTDPKNILKFWQSKSNWYNTWNTNSAMRVDYIRIKSL